MEGAVPADPTDPVREDELALVSSPALQTSLEVHRLAVRAERRHRGRRQLHPASLTVLARLDPAAILGPRPLNVDPLPCPVDV